MTIQLKQNLIKKASSIQEKKQIILKGHSIEYYNNIIIEESNKLNISNYVIFEIDQLKIKVDEKKNFMKGLIAYLYEVEKQLNKVTKDKAFKLWVFQIISELSTLVYPNAGTSYSLIPQDLKKINWQFLKTEYENIIKLKKKNKLNKKNIKTNSIFEIFFNKETKYPQTLICIIAACLSAEFALSINQSFIDVSHKNTISDIVVQFKVSSWINRLANHLKTHIISTAMSIDLSTEDIDILPQCKALAVKITEALESNKLLRSSVNRVNSKKTVNIYYWEGSNFLIYPKQLTLPMVTFPQDWELNSSSVAENGGFFLSEFTNITYQGYLDSKSFQMHNHRLNIKDSVKQINELQNVKFIINKRMIDFIKNYEVEFTNTEMLLITDKWVNPTVETVAELDNQKGLLEKNPRNIRKIINAERIKKRNETLRNQDTLNIAELYKDKSIYWPAVHDFRGRIYRISNLNIQMNEFARSLICFYSDKPPVTNRKKNKSTFEQFNLLLKEILNDDILIKEWDAVFGNRFINNDAFEKLLFESLQNKKLSLIQVSQLLLLREREYDKIGIYYDASASAYQIMSVLNQDINLCQLTNVIKNPKWSDKNDIYEFFKKELINTSDFDKFLLKLKTDSGSHDLLSSSFKNIDRQLVKAAVMPLIYGKTAYGFAEDLQNFFTKFSAYPSNSTALKLSNFIIKKLQNHESLSKANEFMEFLRTFAKTLFNVNNVVLVGVYNDCSINYNKVEVEQLNVYSRVKGLGVQRNKISLNFQRHRISLNSLKRNEQGIPIKSKTKTVNAFVANFVHFIDGQICHFVIEQFMKLGYIDIGTIHDCFFIKPKHKEELRSIYKAGLVLGMLIYELNLTKWTEQLLKHYKIQDGVIQIQPYVKYIEDHIKLFRSKNYNILEFDQFNYKEITDNRTTLSDSLRNIHSKLKGTSRKDVEKLLNFIDGINNNNYSETFFMLLNQESGKALFPNNE